MGKEKIQWSWLRDGKRHTRLGTERGVQLHYHWRTKENHGLQIQSERETDQSISMTVSIRFQLSNEIVSLSFLLLYEAYHSSNIWNTKMTLLPHSRNIHILSAYRALFSMVKSAHYYVDLRLTVRH